jgi:hypothetical protein
MFPGIGRRNNGKTVFLFPESLFPVFPEMLSQDSPLRLYDDIPVCDIIKNKHCLRISIVTETEEWQSGKQMVYRDNKKGLVANFSMEENTKVKQWVLISESVPELNGLHSTDFGNRQ